MFKTTVKTHIALIPEEVILNQRLEDWIGRNTVFEQGVITEDIFKQKEIYLI
jgi:hypothetical protein